MRQGAGQHSGTFYVHPKGNDAWSGKLAVPTADRTDGPKASLAGARDAVRALKAKGPLTSTVRVKIAGGLYVLSEPVTFTPADSGSSRDPVIYEALPGERPIFSGGSAITGFQAGADGLWRVRIPDVANGNWYFEQLFVDDRRAIRARDPNLALDPSADVRTSVAKIKQDLARSFHTMKSVSQAAAGGERFTHKITVVPGALERLAGLTPAQLKDVNLLVYHGWDTTRRFLGSLDGDSRSLTVQGIKWAPWNPWRAERSVPPGKLPDGPGCRGRMVPGSRRHPLLQTLARAGSHPRHGLRPPAGQTGSHPGPARISAIRRKHPVQGPVVPAQSMADPRGRCESLPGGP